MRKRVACRADRPRTSPRGDWPRQATVEVGDTAVDASSAREAGIRSVLVGHGTGLADALAPLG